MSPRALVIAGVLLLAAGLVALAAFDPTPPAEPEADHPTPQAAVAGLEARRVPDLDRPVSQDSAGAERGVTKRSSVTVLVRRPDGKPVSGATVSARPIGPRGRRPPHAEVPGPATTDAAGHAQFAVTEFPVTYVASTGTEIGIGFPSWDVEDPVPITLAPVVSADVEVVDLLGRAVPDASVTALVAWHTQGWSSEFRTRDGGIVSSSVLAAWSLRTDSSGFARFAGLPPADWEPPDDVLGGWAERRVLVEAEGHRSAHANLADGPNRVVLTPAVEYRARVVDEDGRALDEPAWTSGPDARGWGDEEGRVVALVPDAVPDAERPPLVLDADGYLPRRFEVTARAPAVVDLGTVVLRAAVLLRGSVSHADGTPATGILVTADRESADRVFVQGLTERDGTFALEPPSEGVYRVTAGAPGAPQPGSSRNSCWEAVAEHVRPGEERRLVLRFVPGLLVRLVPPDPKPAGFSLDNVSVIPHSADGQGQYDWMPEGGGRYLVRLYGRGPWRVEVRHPELEPVDFEVRDPAPGPSDAVLTREVALRAAVR